MINKQFKQDEMDKIKKISRQYEYSIRSTETDTRDELQLFALMSMIQEAASIDAEYSGLGAAQLDPKGYCWLLLRTSVRLSAIPKWKDRIFIDTWTNGVERLFSIRDFLITDQDNRLMGKATTSWLVVDQKSHRPQKISVLNDPRVLESSFSGLGFSAPKLEESLDMISDAPTLSKYAGYSEIDRNIHVNNTRYVAWCLDAIGVIGMPSSNLIGIDINYITEVRHGETIDIYVSPLPMNLGFCTDAKAAYFITGKHREDHKTAFISILYWDSLL